MSPSWATAMNSVLVLLTVLAVITTVAANTISCKCDATKHIPGRTLPCHSGVCHVRPYNPQRPSSEQFACAAIKTSTRVHYLCTTAKALGDKDRACKQGKPNLKTGLSSTSCLCRDKSYCNLDILHATDLDEAPTAQAPALDPWNRGMLSSEEIAAQTPSRRVDDRPRAPPVYSPRPTAASGSRPRAPESARPPPPASWRPAPPMPTDVRYVATREPTTRRPTTQPPRTRATPQPRQPYDHRQSQRDRQAHDRRPAPDMFHIEKTPTSHWETAPGDRRDSHTSPRAGHQPSLFVDERTDERPRVLPPGIDLSSLVTPRPPVQRTRPPTTTTTRRTTTTTRPPWTTTTTTRRPWPTTTRRPSTTTTRRATARPYTTFAPLVPWWRETSPPRVDTTTTERPTTTTTRPTTTTSAWHTVTHARPSSASDRAPEQRREHHTASDVDRATTQYGVITTVPTTRSTTDDYASTTEERIRPTTIFTDMTTWRHTTTTLQPTTREGYTWYTEAPTPYRPDTPRSWQQASTARPRNRVPPSTTVSYKVDVRRPRTKAAIVCASSFVSVLLGVILAMLL